MTGILGRVISILPHVYPFKGFPISMPNSPNIDSLLRFRNMILTGFRLLLTSQPPLPPHPHPRTKNSRNRCDLYGTYSALLLGAFSLIGYSGKLLIIKHLLCVKYPFLIGTCEYVNTVMNLYCWELLNTFCADCMAVQYILTYFSGTWL